MSVADIFLPTGKIAPFFLPSSAPSDIVASPLQIKSPDDTKTGTISLDNFGDMVISADPAGALYINGGVIYFNSLDTTKEGSIAVANTGDTTLNSDRTLILSAASNAVQIAGNGVLETEAVVFKDSNCEITYGTTDLELVSEAGLFNVTDKTNTGKIYDTYFNPVASLTVLNNNTTGNIAYDNTATRAAGVYQVQLSIESSVPANATVLSLVCSAPPSTAVINFSCASINASAVAVSNQDVALNSGYFTHAGGSLRVLVASSGAAWTGTWSLQLVKIG